MNTLYRMHKTLRNSMEIAVTTPPSILTCKSKNLLETLGNLNAE